MAIKLGQFTLENLHITSSARFRDHCARSVDRCSAGRLDSGL